MEYFRNLGIIEPILKSVKDEGFEKPTEIQEKSIPLILEGKDVIAGSATGSGKTLAFGSVIIRETEKRKGIQALVLTPTRELAEQVSEALKTFSKYKPLRVTAVYGAVCYAIIRFFAFLLLLATHLFLRLGLWVQNSENVNKLTAIWPKPTFMNLLGSSAPAAANWSQSASAFLIQLFSLVVIGFVVCFIISFYFSANTIIYSLMRNKVDNTALEEVYTHSPESNT